MAWQLDTAHTQVAFTAKHLMISTVRGQFKQFSGTLDLDEQTPANSKIDVTIEATSLDSGSEQRDGHVRSADFLDVEHYPTITFKSTRVEQLSQDDFSITGDLTIRGVSRPVVLAATRDGETNDPWGNRRVGFSLTTSINRKDWGLNWNVALEAGGVLVSEKVTISIDGQVFQPVQVPAEAGAASA